MWPWSWSQRTFCLGRPPRLCWHPQAWKESNETSRTAQYDPSLSIILKSQYLFGDNLVFQVAKQNHQCCVLSDITYQLAAKESRKKGNCFLKPSQPWWLYRQCKSKAQHPTVITSNHFGVSTYAIGYHSYHHHHHCHPKCVCKKRAVSGPYMTEISPQVNKDQYFPFLSMRCQFKCKISKTTHDTAL